MVKFITKIEKNNSQKLTVTVFKILNSKKNNSDLKTESEKPNEKNDKRKGH